MVGIKELRWYGVDMTAEAGAILEGIKVSKPGKDCSLIRNHENH